MAKFAEVSYTADGATTSFVVSFSFVERAHVKVYLDDVETVLFSWTDDTEIELNSAPANGVVVKIKRSTSINSRLTDYHDGSKLVEADLNNDSDQAFYLIQETRDLIEDSVSDVTAIDARVTQNEADISTNVTNISSNATNISTNASDISDNADAIAVNAADIDDNVDDINALDVRVTQNEADIISNAALAVANDTAVLVAAKAYADAVSGENLSPWSSGVLYEVDDVCEYLNVIYQCITSHTSTGSFEPTKFEIISRVLSDAEVKVAYENNADTNAFTDDEKTKLSGIEVGATADQTGSQIKALYEAEANTNAFTDSLKTKVDEIDEVFTDAEKAKLAGIEAGATVGGIAAWSDVTSYSISDIVYYTDDLIYKCHTAHTSSGTLDQTKFNQLGGAAMSDADVKLAYESNANTNAFTDANAAKLASIEDSATGDQTATEIKIAYESNADTNAYTDAEVSKLSGIEAAAVATYTNATAMPVAVGGIEAGTTFSSTNIRDILTDLLYPYQYPAFSYFRINGNNSVSMEVGATYSGTGAVFTWATTNSSNVNTNSIQIEAVTGLENDGTHTMTVADETKTTPSTVTYNIQGTNSNSETFSDSVSLYWRYKRYWGVSANTSLNDAELLALGNDELATNHTKSITYDGTGGRYFYFAFPQSFGALTATYINSLNWNDWVLETRDVVNAEGVTIPFYIYRSFNLINGTITVDWS